MCEAYVESDSGLSRVEQVYRKIKSSILSNEFPPGYQALEPEIAKRLGVSRTPVREALIRLEAENLIELIPRRGMRVQPLIGEDILELNQILINMETLAISLLGQSNPQKDKLDPMETVLQEMDEAARNKDMEGWIKADEKYHRFLSVLSGSKRLARMVEMLRAQSYRSRMAMLKLGFKPEATNETYHQVNQLILEGNWPKAEALYRERRMQEVEQLISQLDTHQSKTQ